MKRILLLLAIIVVALAILTRNNNITIPWPFQIPEKKIEQEVVVQESSITKSVENALPSVVTIAVNTRRTPFSTREETERNIGSGFIIDPNGVIVTNKHVVLDEEATYSVLLHNGKRYEARSIVRDPLNDLAIITINASRLPALALGNSDALKLGQTAIAIGTPLGEFTNTVTVGVISGIGRGITAGSVYEGFVERLDNVIQTDAAINPGNSGGPLLTSRGDAIGVNTAVSQQSQNIGFAIPIAVVRELLSNYDKSSNTITRPFLGVRYRLIDRETALANSVPTGAFIVEVVPNSAADKAGIEEGDIITEINGKRINEGDDISSAISPLKVGDTLTITYWRDGEEKEVTATLAAVR